MIDKTITQLKKERDKNNETIKNLKNKVSKKELKIILSKFE
tara:strand:- start:1189 stop:1311 length:123 start_codon:yes stop_codon:yes gene_type:complete